MGNTLTIVAYVRAKLGLEELMIAEQVRLVAASKSSPGCLRYELHKSSNDQASVMFVEEWQTRELWLAHMDSPHMSAFRVAAGHAIGEFALHEMHQIA